MRPAVVEIYSDMTNAAVMRHPDRRFPGVLVQGDTLYALCHSADALCRDARGALPDDTYAEMNDLRNRLWSFLVHYKQVLGDHDIPLPFSEDYG
jgi:hypothetical protein